jgi:hypothetical protein
MRIVLFLFFAFSCFAKPLISNQSFSLKTSLQIDADGNVFIDGEQLVIFAVPLANGEIAPHVCFCKTSTKCGYIQYSRYRNLHDFSMAHYKMPFYQYVASQIVKRLPMVYNCPCFAASVNTELMEARQHAMFGYATILFFMAFFIGTIVHFHKMLFKIASIVNGHAQVIRTNGEAINKNVEVINKLAGTVKTFEEAPKVDKKMLLSLGAEQTRTNAILQSIAGKVGATISATLSSTSINETD